MLKPFRILPAAAVLFLCLYLVLAKENNSPDLPQENSEVSDKRVSKLPMRRLLRKHYPGKFKPNRMFFITDSEHRLFPELEQKYVFDVFPNEEDPYEAFRPIGSCAVVGSSGNLKGSNYGPIIDEHQLVFRINFAPTKGYEQDVGRKTTHYLVNNTWFFNAVHGLLPKKRREYDPSAFVLVNAENLRNDGKRKIFQYIVDKAIEVSKGKTTLHNINPNKVRFLGKAWRDYFDSYWRYLTNKGLLPSRGFLAVVMALHICSSVDTFGFGANTLGQMDYYYNDKKFSDGRHFFHLEAGLMLKMAERGIIKVYPGKR